MGNLALVAGGFTGDWLGRITRASEVQPKLFSISANTVSKVGR